MDRVDKFLENYAPAHWKYNIMPDRHSNIHEMFRLIDLYIELRLEDREQSILIQSPRKNR